MSDLKIENLISALLVRVREADCRAKCWDAGLWMNGMLSGEAIAFRCAADMLRSALRESQADELTYAFGEPEDWMPRAMQIDLGLIPSSASPAGVALETAMSNAVRTLALDDDLRGAVITTDCSRYYLEPDY